MLHEAGVTPGACWLKHGSMLTTSIQHFLRADMHADLNPRRALAHTIYKALLRTYRSADTCISSHCLVS